MHHFTFYYLNSSFQAIFNESNLKVFGELLSRRSEKDLLQEQVAQMVSPVDINSLVNLLQNKFENRPQFTREDMTFMLHNPITHTDEFLDLSSPDQITLSSDSEYSQFFDFMALYYPEMVALELNQRKIISMRLVKPQLIG